MLTTSATAPSASTRAVANAPATRSASAGTTASAPTGIQQSGTSTAALLPATAVGLDGSYRVDYRITAGKGTGATVIGQTGAFTWIAHRSCTAVGCRTTATGDVVPDSPGDASAWSGQVWTGTIECRDNNTKKLTGGSYPYRAVTTFTVTETAGTVATAGTGTQKFDQKALCPGQTSALASNTLTMTFRRTGP